MILMKTTRTYRMQLLVGGYDDGSDELNALGDVLELHKKM